jgi:hypothetical protein
MAAWEPETKEMTAIEDGRKKVKRPAQSKTKQA